MNRFARRSLIGALAGGACSLALLWTLPRPWWAFMLGAVLGVICSVATLPTREAHVDRLMAGGAMGIPLWGLISVIALPLLAGEKPEWSAAEMRVHFPALVGWILYGSLSALLVKALDRLATMAFGPEVGPVTPEPKKTTRILILGGGFAGMSTGECLEEEFRGDPSVSITLVSETNALLFTPMLAEVAGGSLEPSHISTPLRSSLHRTEFIRGRVQEIDLDGRSVTLADPAGAAHDETPSQLNYDHVVLALGAVSNYLGMASIEKHAFNFKSLLDAIRIRNHLIEMFERGDREPDPAVRARLLTFVVAGGGFAGVELAGAINDFSHGILADYPNLRADELHTVLVHSRDRILPELSESLARYAQRKMEERGIVFRLNTRLTGAGPGLVTLSDTVIPAETLVWTAGTAPNPLLRTLPVERDKRGAVLVDHDMSVIGRDGVWALGDCAALTDSVRGTPCPPTAQYALREAKTLASNIHAALKGKPRRPFHFDSLGALCVVGYQTACAELTAPFARGRAVRFSGLLAWLMWRGIYLGKLPGIERKTRVLIDWTIELFFPRDIVQTIDLKQD